MDDDEEEDDEENDWDGEVEWNEGEEVEEAIEGDIADESAAYIDFLNKEAQKFSNFADDDDDDELDEESLLETPLDKLEPYGMFKHVFLSTSHLVSLISPTHADSSLCHFPGLQSEQPQLYESLTKVLGPDEQQILQSVFHEADAKALAAANAEAAAAAGMQSNGNQ